MTAAPLVSSPGWAAALEEVLAETGRVRPVYQPIFDLRRGVVRGFEMLARFDSFMEAPPPEWLAAAERHGVADALEATLVAAGLAARRRLPGGCFLAINVGPRTLDSGAVRAVLAGEDLSGIVIELTRLDDREPRPAALARLRDAGAVVAVDDAAALSLRDVLRVRPEYVKLGREVARGLGSDPAKLAIVEALGAFAGRLDAALVAEGLERRDELEVMSGLGVPLAQGFALGRPARAMRAAGRLAEL